MLLEGKGIQMTTDTYVKGMVPNVGTVDFWVYLEETGKRVFVPLDNVPTKYTGEHGQLNSLGLSIVTFVSPKELRYTWDHIERFENDPCGCKLCKKIQRVVRERWERVQRGRQRRVG